MGGRGSQFGRGGNSSGGNINVTSTTSLISQREGQRDEVDEVLTVLRELNEQYGAELNDVQIVTIRGSGSNAIAYYDSEGNLAFNKKYFDNSSIEAAYKRCVDSKFHPSQGNKTAVEAVAAHEMGHKLTDMAAFRAGYGTWALDRVANDIVRDAARGLNMRESAVVGVVSGYAKHNHAEAVAEAFADVYCNGSNAARESRAIVSELERRLR